MITIRLLRELPFRVWLDWADLDLRGANFTINACYLMGLEDAAWLADTFNHVEDSRRWKGIATDEQTQRIREYLTPEPQSPLVPVCFRRFVKRETLRSWTFACRLFIEK